MDNLRFKLLFLFLFLHCPGKQTKHHGLVDGETMKNAWNYVGLAHRIRRIGELEFGIAKVLNKKKTIFIAFELCPISVSLMPSLLFL